MTSPSDPTPAPRPSGKTRWRSRRSDADFRWLPVAVVGLLVIGAGALWFWWTGRPDADPGDPGAADVITPLPAPGESGPARVPPLELPALGESDPLLRRVVGLLSDHPTWAGWLVSDDLARRFVGAVAAVAAGTDPRERVPFMAPEGEFTVRPAPGGGVEIDPASWRRYDPVVDAFVSFDTDAAVRLYLQLEPAFEEAHREFGFPADSFGRALATAIDNVLAVRVPAFAPAVELDVKTYLFTDPALEGAPAVDRQLYRLGPDNAARVQAKLRTVRDALVRMEAIPRL